MEGLTLGIKQVSAFRATLLKGLDVAFGVCAVLAAVGVITALARREQTSKSEDP